MWGLDEAFKAFFVVIALAFIIGGVCCFGAGYGCAHIHGRPSIVWKP